MALNWKSWTVCHMLLFITFLISGLIVNVIQAVLYLSIGIYNRDLYRRFNYYLVWTIYAQLLFIADWWAGSRIRLFGHPETFSGLGKEHALAIMNHHYELDWVISWMVTDRWRALGNGRVFVKKSLKYVPVVGWAWNFSDVIYLERNWDKDKDTITKGIKALENYPDPMILLFFAEGTRFSSEKHQRSLEFAQERGYPELKHHLIPRVKGFAQTLRSLDTNKVKHLYDVTLVINEREGAEATLPNILTGNPIFAEMYVRHYYTKDLPRDDEQEITDFLMKLYSEKDKLKDNYLKHGSFHPEDGGETLKPHAVIEKHPRYTTLINTIVWNAIIGYPIVIFTLRTLLSGCIFSSLALVATFLGLYIMLRKMIGITKISKASNYGSKKHK